ncbi:MAG TPA: 16S rRNA (cytidine(1402)-2'-O)-methyltransferase [Mycobacteriales bacterium]
MDPGTLILAGAPLGDVRDVSPRLRDALDGADLVAAEDTRRLMRLVADLGIARPARVVSYFDGNEESRTPELVDQLRAGRDVLLITDAGMPSVSDPGYRLVSAATDAGARVTCLPGPSAVTTALAVSGLPSDRFCFEGFLPRRPGRRRQALQGLSAERRTLVVFEAPHRLAAMLADAAEAFGDRPAAVCRELTKTHEEVRRGGLVELAGWAQAGVRGEVTVVIGGAPAPPPQDDPAVLAALVRDQIADGVPRRDAMSAVARSAGVPRRVVYDALLTEDRGPAPD